MAIYVSRYARDTQILKTGRTKLVYIQGEAHPFQEEPDLVAQFEPGLESNYERSFALAAFQGKLVYNEDGTVSFGEYLLSPEGHQMRIGGAMPDTQGRTIGIPGMSEPLQTAAYDITQKMGRFDTSAQGWDAKTEKEVIRLLDLHAGQDYFKVGQSRVTPPWPTYDQMRKGQGGYMKIVQYVKDGGFDPVAVLRYEEQLDEPFQGIIKGLTEHADELALAAYEDGQLQTVVE